MVVGRPQMDSVLQSLHCEHSPLNTPLVERVFFCGLTGMERGDGVTRCNWELEEEG